LAILDVSMRAHGRPTTAREITRQTGCPSLFEEVTAGASGYVLTSDLDLDLVDACAAMRGEPFLGAGGIRALIREYHERVDGRRSTVDGRRSTVKRSHDPLRPRGTVNTEWRELSRTASCTAATCGRHPIADDE